MRKENGFENALFERAKAQLEIKNGLVEGFYYITNLNIHLRGFVLLH